MDMWNVMAGGAAIGMLASCWGKIKEIAWRFTNILIQQVEVPSESAHQALTANLLAKFPRSRAYDRM